MSESSWIKKRHQIALILFAPIIWALCVLCYGVRIERPHKADERPCLFLYNHQTAFDQFFISLMSRRPVYHLASEDIFSTRWASIMRFIAAPIPIKKQTMDLGAVRRCVEIAKDGGTIALAPEGNRTFSGRTGYMSRAIAAMARRMGLPIVLCRIEGGYGVDPRWSGSRRRGPMRVYVADTIEPEEYAGLTNDELFARIRETLYVDENTADASYRSRRRAEYLERLFYVCPDCGFTTFESKGNRVTCLRCGKTVRYERDKTLTGIGSPFPYTFIGDWYDAQERYVSSADLTSYGQMPLYTDRVDFFGVIPEKQKVCIAKDAMLELYRNRVVVRDGGRQRTLPFAEITTVTVLGRNKVGIYHGGKMYQCKGSKGLNAVKYLNLYHRFKNDEKGMTNGEFLGL